MGITPAWAGKSFKRYGFVCLFQDHPRVGGEKFFYHLVSSFYLGSPPRGRGKDILSAGRKSQSGITPAWAGKRPRAAGSPAREGDHPRVGGEKFCQVKQAAGLVGSPPRGRGKERYDLEVQRLDRITPAWAGKRWLTPKRKYGSRDHPRVGGEKPARSRCNRSRTGSPPRGRGKD